MGYKNWRTPHSHEEDIFVQLDEEFHFTLDAAASHANALLPRYCTEEGKFERIVDYIPAIRKATPMQGVSKISDHNGLDLRAWENERVFCNPPYDDLYPWCEIAKEGARTKVPVSVMLLPPSADTLWFHGLFTYHTSFEKVDTDFYTGFRTLDGFFEFRFWKNRVKFLVPKRKITLEIDGVQVTVPDESDPESVEGGAPRAGNLVIVRRTLFL